MRSAIHDWTKCLNILKTYPNTSNFTSHNLKALAWPDVFVSKTQTNGMTMIYFPCFQGNVTLTKMHWKVTGSMVEAPSVMMESGSLVLTTIWTSVQELIPPCTYMDVRQPIYFKHHCHIIKFTSLSLCFLTFPAFPALGRPEWIALEIAHPSVVGMLSSPS